MTTRSHLARRSAALLATALLALTGPVAGGGASSPPSVKGTKLVPVLATFEIQMSQENGRPVARGAVHGVRRVAGATVLYYSLGFPAGTSNALFIATQRQVFPQDRWISGYATPRLIDSPGRRAYTTLVVKENGACVCSSSNATENVGGRQFVFYNVYPPLPPSATKVAVSIGFNTIVADVPVGDGPLEPAMDPEVPIELGSGWPRIDPAVVAAAPDKDRSVHDLETHVTDLGSKAVTVETPAQVSIELSADVLFAVNSAALTPQAQAAIAKAAATVNERAKAGALAVVGHTDSTADDAYNDALSKQRAEAVRAALAPLVKVEGLTYAVEGRGEREPIADNGSDAGRQANRRVSVTFAPQG